MKDMRIEKNSFDFEGFVNNIYKFINDIYGIDPAILIQNVDNPCMTNKEASKKLQKRNAKDLLGILENGKQLYFPFTQAKVTTDSDKIKSVDGTEYMILNNLDNLLYDYDTTGFIVSLQNSEFMFKSAIHRVIIKKNGTSPIEEIKEIDNIDYEQFYKPMESFLKKFVR